MTRPRDIIALMLQRSSRMPPVMEEMGYWKAFFSLRRQGWDAHPDDERSMQWYAGIGSGLIHAIFLFSLLWMAYSHWYSPPSPPQESGTRVRVGLSDGVSSARSGESSAGGSGSEAAEVARPVRAATVRASNDRVPPEAEPMVSSPVKMEVPPVTERPLPEEIQRSVPEPIPSVSNQPVQVTEVEVPTTDYVLPPTVRVPEMPVAVLRTVPDVQIRQRDVVPVVAPAVAVPSRQPSVTMPAAPETVPRVREREIAAPLPTVDIPRIEVPVSAVPPLRTPDSNVRQRDVASPTSSREAIREAVAQDASVRASEQGSASVADSVSAASDASAASASASASASVVDGTGPASESSGQRRWESTAGDDRWSGTARDSGTGTVAGVFDGDGRVRLPDGNGAGDRRHGAPGGDEWTRERIERSGTWLRSPPNQHTPGRFDGYWVPHESLLAEWVRKGIRNLSIPIPGTGKRIQCIISILQAGGGCGISDPNLNIQPAQARPPPDIPFKPELQENNGSTAPGADDVWR
ncbi:MAG: hypothetical protein LBV45_05275 [Xanthomonadaceae bacterium]|jgi:hypothetical protein|nr:hypothetical protein [Xanthomonadaceae bacterium]